MAEIYKNRFVSISLTAFLILVWIVAFTGITPVTANSTPLLWLNPSSADIRDGESVDVVVQLDDISNVYAAQVSLGFDASVLAVVDADPDTAGVQIDTGTCPQTDFVVLNSADNTSGTIDYAVSQLNPTPTCNGGEVATIEFECVATGVTTDVTFTDTLISDPGGNPIAHTAQSGSYKCLNPPTFVDVPYDHWAFQWIEALYAAGITSGCSTEPMMYCPDLSVTRAQMAVFLERGMRGSGYTPPPASGTIFDDVPISHWAAAWIEQLYADGITSGCSASPPLYCPEFPVSRAQMAVFLERAMHWPTPFTPPPASGTVFEDVPASHWAAAWIEQLYADGITTGCSTSPPLYCPENPVSRAQMAVFLVRAFDLLIP